MSALVIHARLDLVIYLYDTTTGAGVDERNVRFYRNGIPFFPDRREEGLYVCINTGRDDFDLGIKVYGYEPYDIPIRYDGLDERVPTCEAFLLPTERIINCERVLSFSGFLSGLTQIEAVNLDRVVSRFGDFQEKKCILHIIKPPGSMMKMDDTHYGLLDEEAMCYETFTVAETVQPQTLRLKEPLKRQWKVNAPICRIIYGYARDGNYLLRVRDDATMYKYLVRYVVDGQEYFTIVDFHSIENGSLKAEKKSNVEKEAVAPDTDDGGKEESSI